MTDDANKVAWEFTVVLLVAVVDELAGILDALEGFSSGKRVADGDIYRKFYFVHEGVVARILLAKLPDPCQGGDAAAFLAASLAERYKPYLLAMVGLCAGDPKQTRLGDVVTASATVRHDFGKITKSKGFWQRLGQNFVFEHRRESQKLENRAATELAAFFKTFEPPGFSVYYGVMSTGNQVVKIDTAFQYLAEHIARGFTGDEYSRGLVALEMEAHAVAYSAAMSKVPIWLIVKGVSDHGDRKKNDLRRGQAVQNAFIVAKEVITNVVVGLFLQDHGEAGVRHENAAQEAFRAGRLTDAAREARKAFELGRRSTIARRRFIQSITQAGDYAGALRRIEDFKESAVLYDAVTREIEATILWRTGNYQKALSILNEEDIQGHRQLLYLRAMIELFMHEPIINSSTRGADGGHPLEKARSLLEEALKITKPRPAWWINVNYYFVIRLLGLESSVAIKAFDDAAYLLREEIQGSTRGTPRLYYLFLLAAADDKEQFDSALTELSPGRHIEVALETLDMIFLRLRILDRRGVIRRFEGYWTEICRWLHRVKTVGRTAREDTEGRIL